MHHSYFGKLLMAGAIALPAWTTSALANPSMLFELESGRVIEHQDAFKRWYPASLSKLMTAYVTFRAIAAGEANLDSPVRMTKHSAGEPPSKMGFKSGQVMRLDHALEMMLIKSANDVAMAIGENIGGSQAEFAARMNAEAQRLGMTGSHFVNPNGLFSPQQYTTARDLALLVRAIRTEFPQYEPMFGIEALAFGKQTIPNFNLLVGRYPGADGMKTGFVCESGFNMIGSATRAGRTLVAVVLGEQTAVSRAEAAARLLDKGFAAPRAGAGVVDVAALPAYGNDNSVVNMRQEICEKRPAAAQSEAPAAAAKDKPKSPYQVRLVDPTLTAVGLGGATGPVPKAMIGKVEYADVPTPSWRPDRPSPFAADATAEGDQAVKGL